MVNRRYPTRQPRERDWKQFGRVKPLSPLKTIPRAEPAPFSTRVVERKVEGPSGIAGDIRIYDHGRLCAKGFIRQIKESRDKKTGRVTVQGHMRLEVRHYAA